MKEYLLMSGILWFMIMFLYNANISKTNIIRKILKQNMSWFTKIALLFIVPWFVIIYSIITFIYKSYNIIYKLFLKKGRLNN